LKWLELFAGSRSIGRAALSRGHEVFSIDIVDFPGIDLVQDIEFLEKAMIPWVPNVVWASPDCATYSLAAKYGLHRGKDLKPRSPKAEKSDRIVKHVAIIFLEWFPGCIYFMENPVGYLRKMYMVQGLGRTEVSYCRYGAPNMKPTDIWSNIIWNPLWQPDGWKPRNRCWRKNPSCHHESSPRTQTIRRLRNLGLDAKKGGTYRMKNSYERSKIPEELCIEIIKSAELWHQLNRI